MLLKQDTAPVQKVKLKNRRIRRNTGAKQLKLIVGKQLYVDTHEEVRRQINTYKHTSTFFYPYFHYERLHLEHNS